MSWLAFPSPLAGEGGEAAPAAESTPFDLASLTKVVATTTVVMDLIDAGALRLDDPLTGCFPEWRGPDREGVLVRDLLEHSSGLPPRLLEAVGFAPCPAEREKLLDDDGPGPDRSEQLQELQ